MEGPIFGLSQQVGEAGGSLIPGTRVRVGSSPDNDGTGRHRQTARVRQARRERVRMQEPVVEPPQATNRLEPGGYGPGRQQARVGVCPTRVSVFGVEAGGAEAAGKVCGVPAARLPGEKLGASLVKRKMVNTGTVPGRPPTDQPGRRWAGALPAVGSGRGGARVVVRGRESRLHGEGEQQDRSAGTARPGGRW